MAEFTAALASKRPGALSKPHAEVQEVANYALDGGGAIYLPPHTPFSRLALSAWARIADPSGMGRRGRPTPGVATATAMGAGFMVQRRGQASESIGGAQRPGSRRTRDVCYGDEDDSDIWARDASSHVWRDGRLTPGALMSAHSSEKQATGHWAHGVRACSVGKTEEWAAEVGVDERGNGPAS